MEEGNATEGEVEKQEEEEEEQEEEEEEVVPHTLPPGLWGGRDCDDVGAWA